MTYLDIKKEMENLGFECTYGSFKTSPTPPYTIIQFAYGNDVIADNQNYKDIGNYQLELYTTTKHPLSEQLIENRLKELRLPYTKVETFLDSEDLYQVIYEFQIIGG